MNTQTLTTQLELEIYQCEEPRTEIKLKKETIDA